MMPPLSPTYGSGCSRRQDGCRRFAGQRRALDGILTFLIVDGRDLDERNIVPPRGRCFGPSRRRGSQSPRGLARLNLHFGPLIGCLADALGLSGVLQFVHSSRRCRCLANSRAHPAIEDIVAAALDAYANRLSRAVSAPMRRNVASTYSSGSTVLEVGTARARCVAQSLGSLLSPFFQTRHWAAC